MKLAAVMLSLGPLASAAQGEGRSNVSRGGRFGP
jgi:hypothetical protein